MAENSLISSDKGTRFLEYLLKRELVAGVDTEALKKEAEEKGVLPEKLLIEKNIIDEEALIEAKSRFLEIPYVDLRTKDIPDEMLSQIPSEAAQNYEMVVFDKKDDELQVAMVNPDDFRAREALDFIVKKENLKARAYITSPVSLSVALKKVVTLPVEVGSALDELERELEEEKVKGEKVPTEKEIERIVEEAPITKVVAVIIRHAVAGRASDIHIEPSEIKLRVRYRVDGVLYTSLVLPKKVHSAVVSRIKILAGLKIDEHRLPQDGRFQADIEGKSFDFRVAVQPISNGEKVAIRLLERGASAWTLEDLGLMGQRKDALLRAIKKPYGLILVTGPTGSGKSTTLYSLLTILNEITTNIVTLEDPIEYHIQGVNQTQVQPEIGLTFASGLRSILRQDPNIIMVGEIRDVETAEMAIHSALTGHLVMSTLHTNNSAGAIPRLIDMGIEPFLITSTLNITVAQRLVKKICERCREEIPIPPPVREKIIKNLETVPREEKKLPNQADPKVLYRGKGCRFCANKGSKGRIGIFEALESTEEIRLETLKNPTIDNLKKIAARLGMISMLQDGILKALAGMVTLEEVIRVTELD